MGGQEFSRKAIHRLHGFLPPLVAQEAVEQRILNFAVHMPALTQKTLTLKAESFEGANRGGISRIDVGFKSPELHGVERV